MSLLACISFSVIAALLSGCLLAQPERSQGLDLCEPNCSLNECRQPTRTYQVCRCDPLCTFYGDCCSEVSRRQCGSNSSSVDQNLTNDKRPQFSCQDVNSVTVSNVNRAPPISSDSFFWYFMITTCPDDWASGGGGGGEFDLASRVNIANLCLNPRQKLPPVSDMKHAGFDYHNEYCAICNGVEHFIRWRYEYQCSMEFGNMLQDVNYTLTQDSLNQYCILNRPTKPSFTISSTGQPSPPERSCYPLEPPHCLEDNHPLELSNGTEENQTEYQTVKDRCFGPTQAPVVRYLSLSGPLPFRNRDCAACNRLLDTVCFEPPTIVESALPSFSVLLDIHNDGLIVVSSGNIETTIQVLCSPTEIYDPVLGVCRSIVLQLCLQRTTDGTTMALFVDGRCITCNKNLVTLNDSNLFTFYNSTAVNYESQIFTIQFTNLQGEPVICPDPSDTEELASVCNGTLIALNQSDLFSYIDEDSVAYGGLVYDVEFNSSRGEPVICVTFSRNGTQEVNMTVDYYGYPVGFFILTYIGCSLSVVGCILVLLTYSLFKELRTMPSMILMNLSVAILITNLLILLGGPVAGSFPDVIELCVALAILLHYFCLSQFSWMSIMSTEMTRTFFQAYKMKVEDAKHSKRVIFTIYLIVGWSLPLLITVPAVVVNFSTQYLVLYGVLEDETRGSCWINHVESAIVALILPIAISLVFNSIMFVITSLFLIHSYRFQAKVGKKNINASYYRLTVAVFAISGLTWGIGFISILGRASWTWYPFIILNSTQGFVIFLAFLFTKKVGKLYLYLLTCKKVKKPRSTISTKQSV